MKLKRPKVRHIVNIALVAALIGTGVGVATALGGTSSASSTPRTAAAQKGVVLSTVSASGNIQSASNLTLGFSTSGKLTEVDVNAGDKVTKGQVLAKIDPAAAQAALDKANVDLVTAQAQLTTASAPTTTGAPSSNNSASSSAQRALQIAQESAQKNAAQYRQATAAALKKLTDDQSTLTAKQSALTAAYATGDSAQVAAAQQDVFIASNAVSNSQTSLNLAQISESNGTLRDQLGVNQAQSSLDASRSSSSSASTGTSSSSGSSATSVASASANVTTAQAAVTAAQAALDATTLTAPQDGTIATVSSKVGDTVNANSSSAASTSTGSTAGATGGAASTSSTSSTSSGFITLTDLTAYQIKAGFSETDAGKVKAGQAATVTVDAAGSAEFAATVDSVDVLSTTVSNVVTYYALLTLIDPSDSIKPGMTATAAVTVDSRENVVHVPTAAVTARGASTTGTVNVFENGLATQRAVTIGLKGDDAIEIVSGLNVGEQVVISTTTASSTASNTAAGTRASGTLTSGGGAPVGAGGGGFGGPPPGAG